MSHNAFILLLLCIAPQNFALPLAHAQQKCEDYITSKLLEKGGNDDDEHEKKEAPTGLEWVTQDDIHKQYFISKNQEAQIYNDDSLEGKSFYRNDLAFCHDSKISSVLRVV